jgi:hypothetical protein
MLDQPYGSAIALPGDASIKADLAAPRWELTPSPHQDRGQGGHREAPGTIA